MNPRLIPIVPEIYLNENRDLVCLNALIGAIQYNKYVSS